MAIRSSSTYPTATISDGDIVLCCSSDHVLVRSLKNNRLHLLCCLYLHCAILILTKNEGSGFLDRVGYHVLIGWRRLYLSWITTNVHVSWPKRQMQERIFGEYVSTLPTETWWITHLEADECFIPFDSWIALETLKRFKNTCKVTVNQMIFGSNNQQSRLGLGLRHFLNYKLWNSAINRYRNTIANPPCLNIMQFRNSRNWSLLLFRIEQENPTFIRFMNTRPCIVYLASISIAQNRLKNLPESKPGASRGPSSKLSQDNVEWDHLWYGPYEGGENVQRKNWWASSIDWSQFDERGSFWQIVIEKYDCSYHHETTVSDFLVRSILRASLV
jgi:hypothetical protein